MNLTSCDNCGVVLDKDKLHFPVDLFNEDGSFNTNNALLIDGKVVPKTSCPVCGGEVSND